MPAHDLAQGSTDQRSQKGPEVYPHVEDRVGAIAARVAWCIEPANLGRDIRLEGAVAHNEREEREKEERLWRCRCCRSKPGSSSPWANQHPTVHDVFR